MLGVAQSAVFSEAGIGMKRPLLAAKERGTTHGRAQPKRRLLLHYHLFKNAGSSVDAILQENFPNSWRNSEYPPPAQCDQQESIRRFIIENPDLEAISSHTLNLPVPEIDGVDIFPIIFVRHPLDRLQSAYSFERKQDADTTGARLAKETDMAGYLLARLIRRGDRSCRNFQSLRLAMQVPEAEGSEEERALLAVDRLPFVGLVEAFDQSIKELEHLVKPLFPEFEAFHAWKNASGQVARLDEKLSAMRATIGNENYEQVVAANSSDLAVHEKVRRHYETLHSLRGET
jgi:hypothetical protein